jgi:hypothetical protein
MESEKLSRNFSSGSARNKFYKNIFGLYFTHLNTKPECLTLTNFHGLQSNLGQGTARSLTIKDETWVEKFARVEHSSLLQQKVDLDLPGSIILG